MIVSVKTINVVRKTWLRPKRYNVCCQATCNVLGKATDNEIVFPYTLFHIFWKYGVRRSAILNHAFLLVIFRRKNTLKIYGSYLKNVPVGKVLSLAKADRQASGVHLVAMV